MTPKQRNMLIRIIVAAVATVILWFVQVTGFSRFMLYIAVYLVIGYDILRKAWLGIMRGRVFDENFLMAVATIGAFALAICDGSGDYSEAIAVMLFYQIGEFFESYAVGRSRRSIASLMDLRPDYAFVMRGDEVEKVDPDEVAVGEIIVVHPGEKIPIDGVVVEGTSTLNTSALTGESKPTDIGPGDSVANGCINLAGVIKIKTSKAFEDSTVAKILELVDDSSTHKAHSETFISRFAKVYTPAICYCALALALLPPFFLIVFKGATLDGATFYPWIYRALTFLVISCPCALVVSIPLSFFAGIGGASRDGILIKGADTLEIMSKVRTVVFDKTGTLTQGVFKVTTIEPRGQIDADTLLRYAASVESSSNHPIARSLAEACHFNLPHADNIHEHPGMGLTAIVEGNTVAVGNARLMRDIGIEISDTSYAGTVVHVAVGDKYCGYITLDDTLKDDSLMAIDALRADGIRNTIMLTGDNNTVAESVAKKLGIDTVYSRLLPAGKVEKMQYIMDQYEASGKIAYVGDGINDAPVLTRADVGIAMGALGSDAAIDAADIVLMDDDPMKIDMALKISRKSMGIVWQNIIMSIGIKAICLVLGAFGIVNLWLAIFADVGVLIIAVLNAMRGLFAIRYT